MRVASLDGAIDATNVTAANSPTDAPERWFRQARLDPSSFAVDVATVGACGVDSALTTPFPLLICSGP